VAGCDGRAHRSKEPYRYFLKNNPSLSIDIFFYDGPISKAVGFDNLLFDAKLFMQRLRSAIVDQDRSQLIHIATDGETYGHHKAYGDRVLAYLTYMEIPRHGYRIVNYAEYLEEHPPRQEVRLIEGENNEGTSWSCAHGVTRWKTIVAAAAMALRVGPNIGENRSAGRSTGCGTSCRRSMKGKAPSI